jgi:hypothetical protein
MACRLLDEKRAKIDGVQLKEQIRNSIINLIRLINNKYVNETLIITHIIIIII